MSAFLAALPAFIAALPTLFQVLAKFMSLAEKLVAYAEKNDLLKWMESVEGAIDELEAAKTTEEKLASARRLSGIVRGLSK